MNLINEKPIVKKYFKEGNLVEQPIYKSPQRYTPVYINKELYEILFNKPYIEDVAFKEISELFSITLDKSIGLSQIDIGFSDIQKDPMNISLSGNLGSGRAYFYKEKFNIKGDKTSLATSKNNIYSNGKFSLSASIRETIISNVISKDFHIPSFQTLAILDTGNTYDFVSEYLGENDVIKQEVFNMTNVLEVRVNFDKELYRISNAISNGDDFTSKELYGIADKFALNESDKFINRFLHGSWSVGNISTNANQIDFDTSSFVIGRHPQYSNTNKYKASYFGYESLGCEMLLNVIYDSIFSDKQSLIKSQLIDFFQRKYNDYLLIGFMELIGLNYNDDYVSNKNEIDVLFNLFMKMAKKFYPNYYDLNVNEERCDNSFIYNFSRFFQFYLSKPTNEDSLLFGLRLLMNDSKLIEYENIGFVKDKVDSFFREDIIEQDDTSRVLSEAINFIKLFDQFIKKISLNHNLDEIKYKMFIVNDNRTLLCSNSNTYGMLSDMYMNGLINNKDLNKIIEMVIRTNCRKLKSQRYDYCFNLNIYDNFMSYIVLNKTHYKVVIIPYSSLSIEYAKVFVNGIDYMCSHIEENILESEDIEYNNYYELINIDINFEINSMDYSKKRLINSK